MRVLFLLIFKKYNCELNITEALRTWKDLNWEITDLNPRAADVSDGRGVPFGKLPPSPATPARANAAFLDNYDDYIYSLDDEYIESLGNKGTVSSNKKFSDWFANQLNGLIS